MPQATEFACPTCRKNGVISQIISNGMNMTCAVNGSHMWNDSMSFRNENPVMAFTVGIAAPPPQVAHTVMPLNLSLPMKDAEAVKARLGPRLEVTIAGWLQMLAQGEVMLVSGEDLERLKKIPIIGKIPVNAGELVGMVYAADLQTTEAKDGERRALEQVAFWENRNPSLIAINLGDQREAAEAKARDQNEPIQFWVERSLRNALENNWF